jgi:ABC-type transport system substrate-binding protein
MPQRRLSRALLAAALTLLCLNASSAAEKVLRYPFPTEETGFDPAQITDLYSRSVTSNIFDAPLRYKWFGKEAVENNVLDRDPEISSDYKTFTFHLKKGIYFAPDPAFNGKKRELTAEDYVYSMKRIYDPHWKSQSYGGLVQYKIIGLEKLRSDAIKSGHFDYDTPLDDFKTLDRYTWQVKVSVPSPRWPTENYTDPSIMGAVAREVIEKYGDAAMEHPVGTGAYMISDWVRSSHITLVKNPNYREDIFHVDPTPGDADAVAAAAHFNGKPMPFLDRIEISIIDESQPRWLSFLNAEQDISWPVPPDLVSLAFPNNKLAPNLKKKDLQAWRVVDMRVFQFLFNMEDPVVGGYTAEKVALRRAIALGLNVPSEIANVYRYQGTPAASSITPGQIGYEANIRTPISEYNPTKANAILDSYGYLPRSGEHWRNLPNGQPFSVEYSTNPTQMYRQIDEIIKKSFDQMGIRLTIKSAQWPQLLQEAQAGTFQTWYLGESSSSTDPGEGMQASYGPAKGGQNLSRFDLPEFNAMYEKQSTIPDGPERLALIHKMVELENAYMPYKFMFNPDSVYMAQPWVIGWYRDNLLADWWRYVDVDPVAQAPYLNRKS